jgi:hypothetical protein
VIVRYQPMRGRINAFAVFLLAAQHPWLLGSVRLDSAAGHWVARKRAEPEVYACFRERSDAATFLAVSGQFAAHRPSPTGRFA